jgi:hypothetical protein
MAAPQRMAIHCRLNNLDVLSARRDKHSLVMPVSARQPSRQSPQRVGNVLRVELSGRALCAPR